MHALIKHRCARIVLAFLLSGHFLGAQPARKLSSAPARPKLVVGLVIDQMRWDFLYRYYHRYAPDGGFRTLMNNGFNCNNTQIDYIPTYTACGHTTLYTGSVPAIHGITGNEWFDKRLRKTMYCTEDGSARGTGTSNKAGQMSPRNLLVTTICDELRIATNYRNKVIGIALKDRGGILTAGHSANAAYWYDTATGNWISSDYYLAQLPGWVERFNAEKKPDAYYREGWETLYPLASYTQSTPDQQPYESLPFGPQAKGFPYTLAAFAGNNYKVLPNTPFGNSLTREMAVAAIDGEQLGRDSITDFLAVSFSSTDYVGHAFGPNSVEIEDTYLRLDREIGQLLEYLDAEVGKGQYLVFLSADHGVAHAAGFSRSRRLPGGSIPYGSLEHATDSALRSKYGNYGFIDGAENNQLFFNHRLIDSLKIDRQGLYQMAMQYISLHPGVDRVLETARYTDAPLPQALQQKIINGYYPLRTGDLQILLKSGWMPGNETGTGATHGAWNPYDAHIPLLWYGWKIPAGKLSREVHMSDVAPTIAALLKIQEPSGCIGEVITEIVR